MDKIEKALKNLSVKERVWIKEIIRRLQKGNLSGLDVKKLKGRDDVFRVRKGDIRIIYRSDSEGATFVLAIEGKSDTTYNF